jgi:hypothetical protein
MEWYGLDTSGSGQGPVEDSCKQGIERLEVVTAVTMKNAGFWDVMPRGSCRSPRFGGT